MLSIKDGVSKSVFTVAPTIGTSFTHVTTAARPDEYPKIIEISGQDSGVTTQWSEYPYVLIQHAALSSVQVEADPSTVPPLGISKLSVTGTFTEPAFGISSPADLTDFVKPTFSVKKDGGAPASGTQVEGHELKVGATETGELTVSATLGATGFATKFPSASSVKDATVTVAGYMLTLDAGTGSLSGSGTVVTDAAGKLTSPLPFPKPLQTRSSSDGIGTTVGSIATLIRRPRRSVPLRPSTRTTASRR